MRPSLVVFAALAAFCDSALALRAYDLVSVEPRILENEVNESIECVKGLLNDGIPEVGIPSFNPLRIDDLTLDFDSDLLKGFAAVENLKLAGITGFTTTHLKVGLDSGPGGNGIGLKLEFTFSFNDIHLSTIFDTNATFLGLVPVYGSGSLRSTIEGLKISGDILIGIDEQIEIGEFKVSVGLKQTKMKITGLYNDEPFSAIISEMIDDVVKNLLEQHGERVNEIVSKLVKGIASNGSDLRPIFEAIGPCLENILG